MVPFLYQLQSSFWPFSGLCLSSSFSGSPLSDRRALVFVIVTVTICLLMFVCLIHQFPCYLFTLDRIDHNNITLWTRCSHIPHHLTGDTLPFREAAYIALSLISLFSLLRWWNAGVLHWSPDSVVSQGKEYFLTVGLLSRSSTRFCCCKHQKYLWPGLPSCHLQCLLHSCLVAGCSEPLIPFQYFLKVLRKESSNRVLSHLPFFVFLTIQVANRKRKLKRRQEKARHT